MLLSFGECNALLQLSSNFFFWPLSWPSYWPVSSSTFVFLLWLPPICKTLPRTLNFWLTPNLFSKCAVVCCWLSFIFCQSCDKTCNILLLISQHPSRKRQSEDGAAGVTGVESLRLRWFRIMSRSRLETGESSWLLHQQTAFFRTIHSYFPLLHHKTPRDHHTKPIHFCSGGRITRIH